MATKEKIDCPICEHQEYTRIMTDGGDYFATTFEICKNCCFTYQNPRYTKDNLLSEV